MDRATANLAAIKVQRHAGPAVTDDEKRVLARFSGLAAAPVVYLERPDEKNPVYGQGGAREGRYARDLARWEKYSPVRNEFRELLSPFEWNAAARATLSAYYTPQALAEAMWDGLRAFGFDGGEVLEAGVGSGIFFGTAPESDAVRLTGVELDPTTARICQLIYPHANVLAESFADTDAPAGAFDVAIGNVPFAQVPFTDRRYGATGHSLHNGFLIKELALVREGGLVMAVTSRWTLDAEDGAARRQMARYGDLLAAYRLPAGVFSETADTDVIVDVLVFRRRPDGQQPADQTWLDAPKREINGSSHTVNAYFTEHPEHVLGALTTHSGRYGPTVFVQGDPAQAVEDLRAALRRLAAQATAAGRGYQPHPDGAERTPLDLQTARDKHANDYTGRLYVGEDGRIWQHINGADPVEAVPSDGATAQLLALMQLRDVAAELKELDRTGDEPARADELRARARQLLAAYTQRYGPLSRPRQTRLAASPEVRARARAEGREVREDERTSTAWGWFREDPDAAPVLALESWDHKRDVPVLSEVLTRRPGVRRSELEHTDDPKVALAAVMGATGRVDLVRIARLLGADPDDARRRLGTEVFDNPATGQLEHAGTYLSGAVRRKLDEAHAAAAKDPTYAVNVAALETVQPREKRIGQFTPQLGAHWIPASLVEGFLRQYLGDPTVRVDHDDRYGWSLYAGKVPDAINALKGTARRSALHIARALLGNGSLIVTDAVPKGNKIAHEVDEDATRAARQKADAMRSAFEEYLTADSTRVTILTDAYNRIMNGHVVRRYDGLAPTLTGFTDQRTPHPWQLAGAARMQFERGVLLAHEVGLGKTTTMILGTQALKAAGQINKPFAVMQPHLAQQWLDEAKFLYPNADIRLITSDMVSGDDRRRTLEWLRSNTPDLTLFTEEAFTSIKMSPEYQEWYEFRELEQLRGQILRERGVPDNALAVRKLEQRLATLEARLRRNAAPMRTPGELYWQDLGFDYAIIDELHRFKGVGFRSKEAGGTVARIRGVDLHQKLTYMHRQADLHGGRPTITGGTGTPLTTSIAEQYTMLALIAPWVLESYGVAGADLWATTFGRKVQRIEMAPDGSGLKVVERFSRFVSKSAMKTMWGLVADTKTKDDVGIKHPKIAGGGPQLHTVKPNADQQARFRKLVARGAAIHAGEVNRDEDNMLAVANEGCAVACDPRLVDPDAPPGPKLAAAADWLASRYHANKDRSYAVSVADPTPHPIPGAAWGCFLDQGTPGGTNKGNFDAYAELRTLLVARDVPREKVAFVHEHNHSPEQLAEFYRQCREGEVAIWLASTGTMGTGANVQNRLRGLAMVDLTKTAADMEQRVGRVDRFGNQNDVVEVAIFATGESMDAWQAGLLADKAEGLRDIQRPDLGDDGSDTVEEIGAVEWDYASMAAEIGGNPYMGQLMQARMDLASLESDRRNHAADRLRQAELLTQKQAEAAATRQAISRRDQVIGLITPVRGDEFAIQIGQISYTNRKDAGRALRRAVTTALMEHRSPGAGPWQVLGRFGGLPFGVRPEMTESGKLQAQVGFPDLRHSEALYTVDDLTSEKAGGTMLARLATALDKAPEHQVLDRQRLPGLEEEIALLTQQQAAVDFTARIEHARQRVNLLDDVVAAIAERDKLPDLREEDLDPTKYPTPEHRSQVIAKRAEERQPLQAKVDQAVEKLETFDCGKPTSQPPEPASPAESAGDQSVAERPSAAAPALPETHRRRRGHEFYPPAELAAAIPPLYATDGQPGGDKTVYLHYFGSAYDCWLAEYDPATGEGFGLVCLDRRRPDEAEWAYVSLPEMEELLSNNGLGIIERDLHWTPVPADQVEVDGRRLLLRNDAPAVDTSPPAMPTTGLEPQPHPTAAELAPAEHAGVTPNPAVATPATPPGLDGVTLGQETPAGEYQVVRRIHRRSSTVWVEARHPQLGMLPRGHLNLVDPGGAAGEPTWSMVDPDGVEVGEYTGTYHEAEARLLAATMGLDQRLSPQELADISDEPDAGRDQPDPVPLPMAPESTNDTRDTAEALSAEERLLRKVADRVPGNVMLWSDGEGEGGHPAVLLAHLADGTYGEVTGVDPAGRPITVRGYVVEARAVPGGIGGRHPDTMMVVNLIEHPSDPIVTVQADMQARLTVLDPPRSSPAGALEPWLRMPVEMQILAAREELGLDVQVSDGPVNELWTVQGCPAQTTGDVAQWLFGGDYGSWEGRAWPVFRADLVQQAVPARMDRLRPFTVPGQNFNRDAAEALYYAQMKIDRGLDPTGDLLHGEVGVGLRSRDNYVRTRRAADLEVRCRSAIGGPASPAPPAGEPDRPDTAGAVPVPASDATSGAPALPAEPASWTSRIEIIEGARLAVRGTTGALREERLRGLLKQYRFRYDKPSREWRYAGRAADRAAAVADIRRLLEAQAQADNARSARPAALLPPTEQQQRILDAAAAGKTVAVQALAGTGKTSTLLMLAAARPDARIVYVAFNRPIADEAARKFGRNVRADTSHAFAREGLSGSPLHAKLAHIDQGLRWPEEWAAHLGISAVDAGIELVEAETIARMVQFTVQTFRESADDTITHAHLPHHLVEEVPDLAQPVLEYARAAWADINDPDGQLRMRHDDYLKIWALGHPRLPADLLLFDEAQDINPVLRKVIQDQPMQTIVVGDSNQSIYGFRGAVDALKHWPADVTLPLTQSWRFGEGVAALGNRFLQLLRSPWLLTGNPAITSTVGPVEQPDAVLARTNAGAVAAIFDAVDDGRRVALVGGGRAIQDIAHAAKDLQAGRRTKHPELSRFADWDEVRAFCEAGEDAQSLRAFVRLVDRRGADALLRMVKELIDEEHTNPDGSPAYDVIVSTAHKSKGREWDHVRIADDFPQPQVDLDTGQVTLPGGEELRLAYVTITRAKRSLELGSLAWIDDFDDDELAEAARGRVTRTEAVRDADDSTRSAQHQDGEPDLTAGTQHSNAQVDEPNSDEHLDGEPDPLGPFNAVEQALIRNAVADFAPGFYGGPLRLGLEDAARYTSEGHLKDLVATRGLGPVWDAVAAVIAADTRVLERSQQQCTDEATARQSRSEDLHDQALAAFKVGDLDGAQRLAEAGQLVDPAYRPGRTERNSYGRSWLEIFEAIDRRRDRDAGSAASSSGTVNDPVVVAPRGAATAAQLARLGSALDVPGTSAGPAAPHGGHSGPVSSGSRWAGRTV